MNATTIEIAARRIAKNEKALQWLGDHGHSLSGASKNDFSMDFRTNFASSCVGFAEAQEVINAFARHHIEAIVKDAISNCRNTIEIDRETILREVSR